MALLLAQADFSVHVRQELLVRLSVRVPAVEFVRIVPVSVEVRVRADDETVHESAESVKDVAHVRVSFVGEGRGGETRASRARTGGENVPSLYTAVFARLDSIDPLMAPGFHSARSFFGAGFRSTRDRSSGSWWRSKDGSGTVGGDGFGTEGDDDGGEDGRGRSGSRCPWKGGRRAVAAEVPVTDFGPEEERYACVNLNARDAPPPVTPQVMRWAEDVRRERRESRVVGKLRLPPPVTTGVLKWAVEANERGEGTVLGPGLFRDLHYYRELRGSIWYIDARPRRSRGSDAKIRRRAGSAPSTPLGRARGRLRTVPEASNEEEGGEESDGTSAGGVSDAAGSARWARPRTV
eukprot:jgi/Mesvir1/2504/Mv24195-RA.1